MKKHYFDYAAATPLDKDVKKSMEETEQVFGNSVSIHSKGLEAKRILGSARKEVARTLGVRMREVIFTSGGTESNNLAIFGTCRGKPSRGEIITSSIEHSSVQEPINQLGRERHKVHRITATKSGEVVPDDIMKHLNENTHLISVQLVNNELGTIQNIADISRIILDWKKKYGRARHEMPYFHTDAAQFFLSHSPRIANLNVDLLSGDAGKIYGPKGVGFLYIREGILLQPIAYGGGQEFGIRPGTHNISGIVGLATALRKSDKLHKEESLRLFNLKAKLISGLEEKVKDISFIGSLKRAVPNILNVSFTGIDSERLIISLDLMGVAVSRGSACSEGEEASRVILAVTGDANLARSSIRISFGRETTDKDISALLRLLPEAVEKERQIGGAAGSE